MAARKSTMNELRKLRELVHYYLIRDKCYFCKKPLLTLTDLDFHGSSVGPKLEEKFTIHHLDGDHDNNDPANHVMSHRSCHKAYHRKSDFEKAFRNSE